ncbi:tetratricopeptide repeat protein, partial [candidate division WOR-3 bacterium]|nr:tetratricopeptide repeat protein [candidate division WOR-3 bacterium]
MKCKECGKIFDNKNFLFCPFCGEKIGEKPPAVVSVKKSHDYRLHGKMKMAAEEIEKALSVDLNNPFYHKIAGDLYYLMGNVSKSIKEFEIAIGLKKDFADAHYALGIAYYRKACLKEAIEQLEKTLEINKDFSMADYWLGLT